MVRSIRPLMLGLVVALPPVFGADDRPDNPAPAPDQGPAVTPDRLEEAPARFVPLRPRTVADRDRIEALRAFSAARALEDRRQWEEAIGLLETALTKDPDSLAVLRRLSRLCFVRGQTERAIAYSRRVIESDPDDTETIRRLERYYERKNDPGSLEALLKGIVASPKHEKTSAGYLLAQHDLGMLYRGQLGQKAPDDPEAPKLVEKAADAFAGVVEALDDKAANRLTPGEQKRILGDEAESYAIFGDTFLLAGRLDLAIRAFRRGLVYEPEDPELPLKLADALIKAGRGDEALALAERLVAEHPQRREPYDLLARSLEQMKRGDEVLPRLEKAARDDPKNSAVQYALADAYDKAGRRDRARALYEQLRASQPIPHDIGAMAAWYLKERRFEDLIKLLGEAVEVRNGVDQIRPQIEAIARDPALADEVLDAGRKMMEADPPTLSGQARRLLAYIAGADRAKRPEKIIPILRLAVRREPNPIDLKELADALVQANRYEEAAQVVQQMLEKFPNLRNPREYVNLGIIWGTAGRPDEALEAYRAAHKLEPNDPEITRFLAFGLARAGKADEAEELARGLVKAEPTNLAYISTLGFALTQGGKNDEAIAFFKDLIDRFPDNDELVKTARQTLSTIYVAKDDYAKGEAELEILYKKDPDDEGINNDLGYLYAEQGKNLEQAEAMVRKALAVKPDEGAYLDSLGWVLFKRGKVREAAEQLEKAVKVASPPDATINDHLGDVYFQLKELDRARAAWERAEKLAAEARPPDKRLPEIRKKLQSLKSLETAPRTATGDTP